MRESFLHQKLFKSNNAKVIKFTKIKTEKLTSNLNKYIKNVLVKFENIPNN